MPGGDGTGPLGAGPMTGRAAGYCAGYGVPGYMNRGVGLGWGGGFGWGRGMGWGRGRGWGLGLGRGRGMAWGRMARWGAMTPVAPPAMAPVATPGAYAAPFAPMQPMPQEERAYLESQMAMLQEQLESVKQRLDALAQAETASAT